MDPVLGQARTRLRQLGAAHRAGTIDAARFDSERRAIERELGDHLIGESDAAGRPSWRLVAGIVGIVLGVALIGYWTTGSPSLAGAGPGAETMPRIAAGPDGAASQAGGVGLQQIATMVETLAERMKSRPDDAQGWTMLARSYTVLSRFDEALPAYKRASQLQPRNAVLLADYADAIAATKGSANNPESIALVERALAVEPKQPKALALAGTAAYDRGDYALAASRWETMAAELPAGSELSKQVRASIDEARQRIAGAASAPNGGAIGTPVRNGAAVAQASVSDAAPLAAQTPSRAAAPARTATTATASTAAAGSSVSGTVTLAPALAGQVAPTDTVFVFARAAGGGRMPLAVRRATVADLPLSFRLDDSMAMAPGATLSGAAQVIVGARISKSGNAIARAGDFSGEAAPVAPGATGLRIRIDSLVSPR
ncbi:MAG: hypothetical protein M3Z29_01730 [Pseudomonadota bacterium]|nr:hypothetical protein [Pseudomonadota bacterium]